MRHIYFRLFLIKQIDNNNSKKLERPLTTLNDDVASNVPDVKESENSAAKKRKRFAVCVITNINQTLEDFSVNVVQPVVFEVKLMLLLRSLPLPFLNYY